MRSKFRHIALFFLCIFVSSQSMHILHSSEDCNSETLEKAFNSKAHSVKKQSATTHFAIQSDHQDCLICHHIAHHQVWEVLTFLCFVITALFYKKVHFMDFSINVPDNCWYSTIKLRGPPTQFLYAF